MILRIRPHMGRILNRFLGSLGDFGMCYRSAILCVVGALLWSGHVPAADRLALLVGCSNYSNAKINPLPGAANDVQIFERFLRECLAFDAIEVLSGWPEDAAQRPTYANITAAFERLIDKAEQDSQVFILLAGHGFRFPLRAAQVNLLDPANPEPDGVDEAFLAADYDAGENMIVDNQVGAWLDRLSDKGAHVWIVFDSCFSGTMTRSGSTETPRELDPRHAGIPLVSLDAARKRANNVKAADRTASDTHDALDLHLKKRRRGRLVAFYAAHDFQAAPEVIRPLNAADVDENRHGLLSYHLAQVMEKGTEQMTYAELGRILVRCYRGDGKYWPTPFFEGDLSYKVLGLEQWPAAKPLLLERIDHSLRLNAGKLAGLTDGAILSVHMPDDVEGKKTLGYVRLTRVSPTASSIESVSIDDRNKAPLESFPDGARCQIVSQDLGDMRIEAALVNDSEPNGNQLAQLRAGLGDLTANNGIVRLNPDPHSADWLLVVSSPEKAKERFGIESEEIVLLLVETAVATNGMSSRSPGNVRAHYPLKLIEKAIAQLEDDLRKIYTWRNLWRVAHAYEEDSRLRKRPRVELEVALLNGPDDRSPGERLKSSRLHPNDCLAARLFNKGYKSQWYTVFFLDGRYGIEHVGSGSLPPRMGMDEPTKREVDRMTVNSKSSGAEGYVVIAVSHDDHPNQPDYSFLAQPPLGEPMSRRTVDVTKLRTPFERLLSNVIMGKPRLRSAVSPDNPHLMSWSWLTMSPQP